MKKAIKAIFLDRDGTVNREVNGVTDIKLLVLLPSVGRAIKKMKQLDFLVFIVTNQAVVARGHITEAALDDIHKELLKRLRKNGAEVDGVYVCPHHPIDGIGKYKKLCVCRKPGTGLVKKAIREFGINPAQSFFVGDMTTDILTVKRAGLKTILLETGHGGKDGRYKTTSDYRAKNLLDAVKVISSSRGF